MNGTYSNLLRRCHLVEDKYFVSGSIAHTKIKQEAADFDNLALYIATSLSFTESFSVSKKRKTEFKKPTTGCCFPCESEFTPAGNFQTKDSNFQ